MIKTTLNWTIKNLKAMHDSKETLNFDHPIQRQSAQWTNLQQSLLVHSILANYPVPAVYVEKTDSAETDDKGKAIYKYSVLDGKQRMTTVFSFINGEYALNEETPAAEIEGETYELAGKTFEELDEDVRQELLRFKFSIFAFEDATDDEIEEIFFRLNNSTPLSKPQKARPLMGTENARFINSILTGSFFTEKCNFSKLQLRKSDDMCTLLQSMMLLDHKYGGYEYASISADEVMKYSAAIKGNYSEGQKDLLLEIIDYLDEAFDEKEKLLKKINVPMVVIMADIAIKEELEPDEFHDWFLYFFVSNKEYSQYCSSGSIKKEKVLGRLTTMEAHFTKHFKLDAPAEAEEDSESDEETPKTDSTDTTNLEESEISTEETAESEDNETSAKETVESEERETSTEENESEEDASQEETDSFMNPPADTESEEELSTKEEEYLVEQGA